MASTKKQTWLSAHLYYNEPWETFLVEAVAPYIETVMKTGIADAYFFIRYWEYGPHIRLRFRGEESNLKEVLQANLMEHFNTYFLENPSPRTEPTYPPNFPVSQQWLPNNSIQFITYTAETNRYGGKALLSLSETQFQLSSAAVLDYFIRASKTENYSEVLGEAIRLHLSYVHSMGLDLAQAKAFFNMVFENWLPRAFEIYQSEPSREVVLKKMNETVGLFNDAFAQQKESLTVFHEHLLNDLKSGFEFENPVFNEWIHANKILAVQFEDALNNQQIEERKEPYLMMDELEARLSSQERALWNIYADHIHMTNNRLGIMNQDEAYLAYLMKCSLEQL